MSSGVPPPNAITERIILPVKGGVDDWKEPYKQFLLTLKEQPGFIRSRWGPRSENMGVLDLLTGWESPEAKQAFLEGEAHSRALDVMKGVLNGTPLTYSIKFKPYAPKDAINAPIVEVITISNCTGDENELRAQVEKGYNLPGARSGASGFSTSEVAGQGRIFVGVIGWDSIEASKAADKSYVPQGAGEVEIHHVNFLFPIKGFSVTNTN
ncbi:hypothetical protein N0V93_003062 [Gnomoniopsis smithogilvyi]|uniref:ABM domain-containing protein n=1 Tax=Gnomoniopsis smithogilvyi TaxID=1191159 RepID=A0A9W8YZR6_9PEZI|nr:hypothetical protein N0V93_003062 [Gnomoniopsis smithogilvyi]